MAPGSARVDGLLREVARTTLKDANICSSCRYALARRSYASAATAQVAVESPPTSQVSGDGPGVSPTEQSRIDVKAGVVLSRPPLVTPDPHPFETAYHLYQRRLNERLVLPFTQNFYFKRSTPAFDTWRAKKAERAGTATRDIGNYNPYRKEGWNDEVVVGDETGQPRKIVERLIEDEGRATEFTDENGDLSLGGLKRTTAADAAGDQKSLERRLSRTLYLLVKSKAQSKDQPENTLWRFPSGSIEGKEGLKEAAQRILDVSCGPNMNTWFVGNHPVGHYVRDLVQLKAITSANKKDTKAKSVEATSNGDPEAEKTFFMKARIFAGQADLQGNKNDVQDFKWVSKDEIEKLVSPGYWSKVKNMLVEQ